MTKIGEDCEKETFERVYLLYGPENFLKRSYKNQLRDAITKGDSMNLSLFEGEDFAFEEVRSLAETLPFFAGHRCMIFKDTGLFKNSSGPFADFLPQIPDTTTMIFVESEVDKRSRMYKAAEKTGYCLSCERRTTEELQDWVVRFLAKEGKKITRSALDTFLLSAGDDMDRIYTEMEKLTAYMGEQTEITLRQVREIGSGQVTGQIFQMVEAVAAGREKEALRLYYDLDALREPSLRILFLLARQINELLQVKMFVEEGKSQREIEAAMKLKSAVTGRLIRQAKSFTKEQLKEYVDLCVSAEEAAKTGKMDSKLAVEMVILTVSRREKSVFA